MTIIEQSHIILDEISPEGHDELARIERCGRLSYQSDNNEQDFEKTKRFVKMLIDRGHESVLEHGSMTVIFVTDRAIANELVRHRLASFTQESTRYCNYMSGKFGETIRFIRPVDIPDDPKEMQATRWYNECGQAEWTYQCMIAEGKTPEQARDILPLCTKTEIAVTANWREWRHILKLRTAKDAHPQMRALMIPLLKELQEKIPVLFDDILVEG